MLSSGAVKRHIFVMALFRVIFPPRLSPLSSIARTRRSLGERGNTGKKINVPRRLICGSVTRYRWGLPLPTQGFFYIWFFNPFFFYSVALRLLSNEKKSRTSCIVSVSNVGVSLLSQTYMYHRPNEIKQLLRAL